MKLKLGTVIVVHDRLELTLRTIGSYLETTREVEKLLVIVDSGSGGETFEALCGLAHANMLVRRFDQNVYPGRACNHGWEHALRLAPDITHLHRSDNDVEYLPGWVDVVAEAFRNDSGIGQLGLLEERFEQGCFNVGGNSVIRRDLWDAGVRWDETPWGENSAGAALNEDALLSAEVARRGYRIGRVQTECVRHLGWDFDAYPDYYAETSRVRGYQEHWIRDHFDRMRAL